MSKATRTGGCQCGAVRFEITADRLVAYACHCLECQKQSASAFGISVPVRTEAFTVEGPLGSWTRTADSGAVSDCVFCQVCGTRVYHARGPEWVIVKGGAFDDAADLSPRAHLWVRSKLPWFELPGDAVRFDTQPADLPAWREKLVAGGGGQVRPCA